LTLSTEPPLLVRLCGPVFGRGRPTTKGGASMETEPMRAAMVHDGVVPESLVILVEE
jgi:hypothetical protein